MSDIRANLKTFDLDAALDSIDLSFPNYTPSEDSLEFFALMRMVQGEDFEFDTPMWHFFVIDVVFGNVTADNFPYSKEVNATITVNHKRIAVVASRGLAKSTVLTAFLPIYCAIKGKYPNGDKTQFHLLLAASAQGGGRVLAKAVQSLCDDSVFCNNYFESMEFTESESRFIRSGNTKAGSRTFLIRYMGIGGGIRGQRDHTGTRPDTIMFDDVILNSDAAYSETIMGSLRTTIAADAINALIGGGRGRIISVATPFHALDPIIQTLTGGAYTPVAIPICENIYEGMPKSEFRGAWVSMHPYEAVIDQYHSSIASHATKEFNQERMLRITSDEDRMIHDEMLQWYSRKEAMKSIHAYRVYVTTDFTTTSEAKSDFSAIAVWLVNSNRDFYLADLCVKRQGIGEQYEEVFRMVNFWTSQGKSVDVGIEIDGQQLAHLHALREMMPSRGQFFTFARQKGAKYGSEGIRSKSGGGSKHERFRTMLPMFQNHKFYFPLELKDTPDMKEGLKQLRHVSYSGFGSHDDFCDAISQLNMIDIIYPNITQDSYSADSSKDRSIWRDLPSTDNDSAYSSYA